MLDVRPKPGSAVADWMLDTGCRGLVRFSATCGFPRTFLRYPLRCGGVGAAAAGTKRKAARAPACAERTADRSTPAHSLVAAARRLGRWPGLFRTSSPNTPRTVKNARGRRSAARPGATVGVAALCDACYADRRRLRSQSRGEGYPGTDGGLKLATFHAPARGVPGPVGFGRPG